jgi:hypothetical protein
MVYCLGAAGFGKLLAITPSFGIDLGWPDSEAVGLKSAPSEY